MKAIHSSIKERLGYGPEDADEDVIADWRARLRRVSKPCWELKYCPYGPLVEQSPLLPPLRDGMAEGNKYQRICLATGLLGQVTTLDEQRRGYYEEWLKDDSILNHQALHRLRDEIVVEFVPKTDDPIGYLIGRPLPPIEKYRVPFDIFETEEIHLEDIDPSLRARFAQIKEALIARMERALRSGIDDTREPLDPVRRMLFEREVREFSEDNYPEEISDDFTIASCTIFGHICPVYFTAEAATETATERRRGRYITFSVKMRVVRRDNYTCQSCSKHLSDTEVESITSSLLPRAVARRSTISA